MKSKKRWCITLPLLILMNSSIRLVIKDILLSQVGKILKMFYLPKEIFLFK